MQNLTGLALQYLCYHNLVTVDNIDVDIYNLLRVKS